MQVFLTAAANSTFADKTIIIAYTIFIAVISTLGLIIGLFFSRKNRKHRGHSITSMANGYSAARNLLNCFKLFDIKVIRNRGGKRDNYDYHKKILYLSDESYLGSSAYSIATAMLASTSAAKIKSNEKRARLTFNLVPPFEYLLKFVLPLTVLGLILGFMGILIVLALTSIIISTLILIIALVLSLLLHIKKQKEQKLIFIYLDKLFCENPNKLIKPNIPVQTIINERNIIKVAIQNSPPTFLIYTLLSPIFFLIILCQKPSKL